MADPKPETAIPVSEPPAPRPSQITTDQMAKITAWFNAKIKGKPGAGCPLCGTKNWSIGGDFVAPPNFTPGGGLMLGGPVYPHFMLVCDTCSNTQFINAIIAGVIPK